MDKGNKTIGINVEKLHWDLRQAFRELVLALIERYNDEILSIVVFGSATTGDWIRGKSDVDFIVVVDDKKIRKDVERFTNSLLIKLSTKYDLRLTQTCSAFKKTRNPILNAVFAIESFLTFGKPFFVLSRDQINLAQGRIIDTKIVLVTSIFDSMAIFAMKIKQTGSTIYGEDILRQLRVNRSAAEKIKALMAPLWIIIMSLMVFPVDSNLALDHSVKATFWACEDILFYFDKNLSSTKNEIRTLREILSDRNRVRFEHLEQALKYRRGLKGETKVKKGNVAQFLFQTSLFVLALYCYARAVKEPFYP